MQRKTVIFGVLAAVSLVLFVAVSAVTVYAMVKDTAQANTVEVAPVMAETVSQPQVEKPAKYEYTGYAGGCSYDKARLQMTEAPAEKVAEDQLLTQVAQ
jgi:hypothetical protein